MVEEQYDCKSYCFFSLKPLEAMKKQKLINEEDDIFFIDSTSIKVSPDANKNKNNQKQGIGRSKGGLTTKLHLCCTSSCPVVFRLSPGNSHDAPEGRKLIESIYSKNNNYLLMDRAYEDDKTLALANDHGFHTVVPLKKNRKLSWSYDRHLYKHRNIIEQYFLRLKRFRKVFTRYDKLDSISISTISLAFIFDLLFM